MIMLMMRLLQKPYSNPKGGDSGALMAENHFDISIETLLEVSGEQFVYWDAPLEY